MSHDRRDFLKAGAIGALAAAVPAVARAAIPTPRGAEGPFYPTEGMRFADIDNDLVKIEGQVRQAGGEVVRLTGRVLDRAGAPLSGVRVEIWQVDANARYLHTGDRGGRDRDPAFQGFGVDVTDADGRYRFRTIKPVAYPGRTPHIHVKVFGPDRVLTTQFFLAGDERNERDGLYRRMSEAEKQAVAMAFSDAEVPEAVVDVVL